MKICCVVGVLLIAGLYLAIMRIPVVREIGGKVLQYIQFEANPALGALLFVLLDIACIVLLLPSTPLNLAAGFILGTSVGTPISITGITIGAVIAFILGRTCFRNWASQKAKQSASISAMLEVTSEHAFLLIFLLRLCPIMPFPALNYALGISQTISFTTFLCATVLGICPSLPPRKKKMVLNFTLFCFDEQ